MFDLGAGELLVLGIVLLVVVGPRELPRLLRALGRGIRKLRSTSMELRSQSGIDDAIQEEGLQEDLETVRSLSRGRVSHVVDALVSQADHEPHPAHQFRPASDDGSPFAEYQSEDERESSDDPYDPGEDEFEQSEPSDETETDSPIKAAQYRHPAPSAGSTKGNGE